MSCEETNNILERLECKSSTSAPKETTQNSNMPNNGANTNNGNVNVNNFDLDFHKELHQTTIKWSVGAMITIVLIIGLCALFYKICRHMWNNEKKKLLDKARKFDSKA